MATETKAPAKAGQQAAAATVPASPANAANSLVTSVTPPTANFAFGKTPIWMNPCFGDLFFDALRDPPKHRPVSPTAFTGALELLMTVYSNVINTNHQLLGGLSREEMAGFTLLLPTISEAKVYTRRLDAGAKADAKDKDQATLDSLTEIFSRLRALSSGGYALVPGGWHNAEGGHNIMFVVQRKENAFTLAVCNTGDVNDGIKYHPVSPDATPDPQYKLTLVVDDIPLQQLLDTTF